MIEDALKVGLAIGVIMAFTAWALARILLDDAATRAERAAEDLRAAMYGYAPERVTTRPRSRIWTPPGSQERESEGTVPVMEKPWADSSSDEKAAAVMSVLPTHYEDSNGVTAQDVAHRLGIRDVRPAGRVAPVLRKLVDRGDVQVRWDKANRRRRTYTKSAR
jgi:hypothetical protein